MPYYAVDRIEGEIAVLVGDDGTTFAVPRHELPRGAREGSVLSAPTDAAGRPEWAAARLDEAERERRLKHAQETLDRLRASDPGGDITL